MGIPKEYHCPGLSETVLNAWSHVVDVLEEAGATVTQVVCLTFCDFNNKQ